MNLRAIAGAALMLGALCSCTTVREIAGLSVNQRTIAVAVQTFDAVQISAAKYVALPNCAAGQTALANACKDPAIAAIVKTDVLKARAARDSLWAASKASPSGIGVTDAYHAFVALTATVKTDMAKN